jgi:hypothetical protein
MASKSTKGATSPLDLAMAALAAGSVGFVIYVMPAASFDQAVELSGLPLLVPAANPPLGLTARIAVAALAAAGIFVLVALVLRALSKSAPRPEPKRRPEPVEIEIPLPKLRRADAHPDAPARRPIFAGLDLGEPFDPETFGREPERDDFLPAVEAEEAAPVAEDASNLPPEEDEIVEHRPLPSFVVPQEPEEEIEEIEAAAAPAPEAAELADHGQASISHLMQRLELGLVRRDVAAPGTQGATPFGHSGAGEAGKPVDHRLRSAIDELQQLAARGR